MSSYALAIGYALFLWWFSTGVILYLNGLPPRTYRASLIAATALMILLVGVIFLVRDRHDLWGAYLGFTAGVLVWGWLEMVYFMGLVTGPHKQPCPPGCRGWRRFRLALGTSIYHELLLLLIAALLVGVTWDAANQVGTWAFVILWLMRWSAKLNLFLGVPNLNEDWLPDHVRFITSYLRKRPMNLLFPVSVSVATVVMSLLVEAALELSTTCFAGVSLILAATLLALAILEHWFLVLPLADAALWRWVTTSGDRANSGRVGNR
ncbi:MAG: putative photosynthetic complex assembly protein PuhE [Lamprobacter sp.]|uniref:putative photosynthetic complex assembly protein PuhE n=1 Tax=Lamprobacter sp. TaxID=3100796 RepID=UPI002B258043|nr:putative photosynthetic complex assembly protein PuhE [Lamprobacter sp.]MEA3639155.1 putative photosynthetic complex assembly protein PuhE [Lamprobacter sp.]